MTVEDCKPWRYHFGCDNQGWVQNYILAGPDEMLPELFLKECLCCLRVQLKHCMWVDGRGDVDSLIVRVRSSCGFGCLCLWLCLLSPVYRRTST